MYNFRRQTATELTEAQETVKYYWKNKYGLFLDEKRWDIYPIGFSSDHPDIIIFNAYGFTGRIPKFLGMWSIDADGEFTELVSPNESSVKIGMNGYRLLQTGVLDPAIVHNMARAKRKKIKQAKKAARKERRAIRKEKRQAYHQKIKEMKKQEREVLKHMR